MNDIIYEFENSNKIGKFGENIIYDYIKNNFEFDFVQDVSGIKDYQDFDIDLVCGYNSNHIYTVEIKTDTYNSGNLFFETISCVEKNTKGCMLKTYACYLFYYFINTGELYIININKYRDWVLKNAETFKIKKIKNKTYHSLGLLIPKERLENEFKNKYFKKVKV